MEARIGSRVRTRLDRVSRGEVRARTDSLASEEPLELRLVAGGRRTTLAVTMRTPGNDFELGAGFLHSEGLISEPGDLRAISYCRDPETDPDQLFNIVNLEVADPAPDVRGLQRNFFTSSSCGVCGKASLESLSLRGLTGVRNGPETSGAIIEKLPERLREEQSLFEATGGLHAAGLFDASGELIAVREDVGRHNALDKLIGWALLEDRLPLDRHIVLVSGRASFEIVQKCLAARVPIVCAVSAPSSLSVEVARSFGMTLIGFLRGESFNIYSGPERIATTAPPAR